LGEEETVLGGAAQVRITPKHPVELWGYAARQGKLDGVLDDLFAKVVVLEAGGALVLAMLDLGGVSKSIADAIRERIAGELKLPASQIGICATHTHAAPAATPFRGIEIDQPYIRYLSDRVVECAARAAEQMGDVTVGYTRFDCHLNVNRRERGTVSDLSQPSGAVDPQVSLVRVDRSSGEPMAVLINYAMHPVTLRADNLRVSADYPGAACAMVAEELDAIVGFLQGCSGNLNPKKWGGYDDTLEIGRLLGREVLRHVDDVETAAYPAAAMRTKQVVLPVRKIAADLVNKTIEEYEQDDSPTRDLWAQCRYEWAVEYNRRCRTTGLPSCMSSLAQAAAIGPLKFAFLPGEPLTAASATLKKRFGASPLVVSAYCNDASVGYIPGRSAERDGGYEVDEAFKFYGLLPLAYEAEDVLLDACSEMLRELES
jgi:hypothetical protein